MFDCGEVGVGAATPRAFGAGVGLTDGAAARSSAGGAGVFSGLGVSSSSRACLGFAAFLPLGEASFS